MSDAVFGHDRTAETTWGHDLGPMRTPLDWGTSHDHVSPIATLPGPW